MASDGFVPIASRAPPRSQIGVLAGLQRNFFNGPLNTALTIAVLALLALALPPLLSWAVLNAVFAARRRRPAWSCCCLRGPSGRRSR